MASFKPNKIDLTAINNGNRYENGDFPTPETFNAPIEAAAFAQNIATNNESQISSLKSKVENQSDQISRNTKQIENLESQISGDLIVKDSQIAYETAVPSRSAPNALIEMFGGMSYKSTNKFNPQWLLDANKDVRLTADGFYYGSVGWYYGAYGQPLAQLPIYSFKSNTSYTIRFEGYNETVNDDTFAFKISYTDGSYIYSPFMKGTVNAKYSCETDGSKTIDKITILYNYGDMVYLRNVLIAEGTDIPYEPYFSDLRHTKPTAFKIFGANLWQQGDIVASGYNAEIKNVFENLTPNKPYSISWDYSSDGTEAAQDVIIVYTDAGGFNIANGASFTITQEQINTFNIAYGYFGIDCTSGKMTNIMLNEGEIALPYMPLREPIIFTLPIIDGLEYGIDGNYYNFVDWKNKLRHKRVVRGIISNVYKPYITCDNLQYYAFDKPTDFIGYNSVSNAFLIGGIETKLTSSDWDNSAHIGTATGQASYESIWVGFPIGTTLEEAKAALEGKEWVYALGKEQVYDISHLLPSDNLVAVQRGGALSVESNYNGYALPRTIVYQLRASNRD